MKPILVGFVGACIWVTGCGERADPDPPTESLLAAAEEIYWQGEIDSAQVVFEAALDESRQRADPVEEASALTWLGLAAWRLGDYEEARRLGEQALDLKLEHSLQNQLFRSYNALGLLAWNESRYFEALDLYQIALELAEAESDSTNLVKVWTNLGLLHTELGDFVEAQHLLNKALVLSRELDEGLIEGRVLTNLGMLAVRTGDPVTAIGNLEAGLMRLRDVEDLIGEQNALGQLGMAYAAAGEMGRAVAVLDSALQQSRIQGLRQEEATHLEQTAELYREAGDFRRALSLFEEARAINDELGLEDETGIDFRSQAEVQARLENLDLAHRLAGDALAIHRHVGSRFEELADLLLLAELSSQSGDSDEARRHLETAGQMTEGLASRRARASVALAAARIADHEGDGAAVIRILHSSIPEIVEADHDYAWEAHALLARTHARAGDLEEAAAAGRQAVEAVERVRGRFASGILRTSYQTEREAVYGELVDVLLELGRTGEAFEVADAARGRVLVEHLATARANGGASVRELAEEERQILAQIDWLAQEVDEIGDPNEVASTELSSELDQLYRELENRRTDYGAALVRSQEHGGQAGTLLGGARPEEGRVRAALHAEEALIEYLVSKDEVLGFVATSDEIQSFRAEVPRRELAMRVRVARELVGRPSADPETLEPVLAALHEILIGPAARTGLLDGKRALVIVPHGELTYVPFAALRDPRTGRYLALDFTLLDLPSAASLPVLRGGETVVTSGQPAAFAPFPRELPATVGEADAVHESLGRGTSIKGGKATEAEFRDALAEVPIVHAATHGIFNLRNPLFSRLRFAPGQSERSDDDGRLEVHELVELEVNAWLVFLSGCETGVGGAWSTAFGQGEDFATLARAFLYSGAANVIATLWRVEDEGAAAFARSFYHHLGENGRLQRQGHASVSDALALAQRELIRSHSYHAPYYWAGYRVTGSGHAGTKGLFRATAQSPATPSVVE